MYSTRNTRFSSITFNTSPRYHCSSENLTQQWSPLGKSEKVDDLYVVIWKNMMITVSNHTNIIVWLEKKIMRTLSHAFLHGDKVFVSLSYVVIKDILSELNESIILH